MKPETLAWQGFRAHGLFVGGFLISWMSPQKPTKSML
jgi:hypothetical protein